VTKYVLKSKCTGFYVGRLSAAPWQWVINLKYDAVRFDSMTEAVLFAITHKIENTEVVPVVEQP
jgi:hypothetical protein